MLTKSEETNAFKLHLQERTGQLYDDVLSSSVVDWDNELLTFLIYSTTGQLTGTVRYDWRKEKSSCRNTGKYSNHISNHSIPFGLHFRRKTSIAVVTEGIFDTLRCIEAGYDAYPLLSTDNKPVIQTISLMGYSEICYLMDSDCKGINAVRPGCLIRSYAISDIGQDPNSMTPSRIKELVDKRVLTSQLKRNFNEHDLRRHFNR